MKLCHCELSGELETDKESEFCEQCDGGTDLIDFYRKFVRHSAVYPNSNLQTFEGLNYCIQKLTSEAGEVSGKVGKFINKNHIHAAKFSDIDFACSYISDKLDLDTDELRKALILELGDTLWYIFESAHQLNTTVEEILVENIKKIAGRHKRGTVIGDGDNR